ncbi:MAG: hypothetical protein Q7T07_10350 [Burkholderiaceae bacterium]|nr:hypothetical protein [Burkholderiaceae bacterium]
MIQHASNNLQHLRTIVMKSFLTSRRTRLTATVMLFVWLMTLGVSIANACLVHQDEGRHSHLVSVAAADTDHQDSNGHDMSPETLACLDFCAAEQSTLVKVKAQLDSSTSFDFVPVLYFTGLLVPTIDRDIQPKALGSPTWSEPPVSIRFSRLTI